MKKAAQFDKHSRQFMMAAALALAVVTGWIDYLTGHEYSVSILYLIPVFLAAWFAGKGAAVATAVACAAAWLTAELLAKKYAEIPLVLYWNDMMELGFFLVVAYSLSALKSALEHEKTAARTDVLTGIANRRHFYDLVDREIKRLTRYGHVFSVAYIDIDNFKAVNDTFGHSAGDALLRLTAEIMNSHLRATDTAARLGGDEFGVLLPETGADAARIVLGKIQREMQDAVKAKNWSVSLSVGMITYLTPPASADKLLERIDALMYEVKRGGKSRIRHEVADDRERKSGL
jgi:diguanylate cyclase (GGDEF)-like protein